MNPNRQECSQTEEGASTAAKASVIPGSKQLLLATAFAVVSNLSNAYESVPYANVSLQDGEAASVIRNFSKRNGFDFPDSVVDGILKNIITISTEEGVRTGVFVTPKRAVTSKHGNAYEDGTPVKIHDRYGKSIKSPSNAIGISPHPDYDLSVIEFKGIERDYYGYVNNSMNYGGKLMFVGAAGGRLVATVGTADQCKEHLQIDRKLDSRITTQVAKALTAKQNSECATGSATPGMSGGMVLDQRGNLFGIIVGGDGKVPLGERSYVLYHPTNVILKDPSVAREKR